MTVVSNAGPLIALARIRETEWLPHLYGDILAMRCTNLCWSRRAKHNFYTRGEWGEFDQKKE